MKFKEFLEELNPAFLTTDDPPEFGSGRDMELPSNQMGDMTDTIQGVVTDVRIKNGDSVVDKIEDNQYLLVKVKTEKGTYQLRYHKSQKPEIGQPIKIVLNRFGEIEKYY